MPTRLKIGHPASEVDGLLVFVSLGAEYRVGPVVQPDVRIKFR
ncbi:hypothetical protein [Tautonia marina]|nr:hypothetical protein [Tautonia marina]